MAIACNRAFFVKVCLLLKNVWHGGLFLRFFPMIAIASLLLL